jgi:hypothetical protein
MDSAAQEIRFETRAGYQQAIDAVLASATRGICIFDPDLKDLDLGGLARAATLDGFLAAASDRSLRIVVHDADHLSRFCPRLTALHRRFGHAFSLRQAPESLRQLSDCFILADNGNAAIRFHADHFRGKLLLAHPDAAQGWGQRFEDLWRESLPAAPATHLGL